jgi:hypothetical protein
VFVKRHATICRETVQIYHTALKRSYSNLTPHAWKSIRCKYQEWNEDRPEAPHLCDCSATLSKTHYSPAHSDMGAQPHLTISQEHIPAANVCSSIKNYSCRNISQFIIRASHLQLNIVNPWQNELRLRLYHKEGFVESKGPRGFATRGEAELRSS